MAHALNTTFASSSLVARLRDAVTQARTSWALHREYKRTFDEMDALSDRELADIGVRRSDISDIARTHIYGA